MKKRTTLPKVNPHIQLPQFPNSPIVPEQKEIFAL